MRNNWLGMNKGALVAAFIGILCLNWTAGQASAEETAKAAEPVVWETEYVSLKQAGDTIISLRFDGTGQRCYGLEAIAPGGALRNVAGIELVRNHLTIVPGEGGIEWDIPFVLDGHYDSDAHLNYPDSLSTNGATALTLPFRSFVGSSGQVTRVEHFKNLDQGDIILWLNIEDGQRLLMQSDLAQNWDLDINWPGCDRLYYEAKPDRLVLKAGNPKLQANGPLTASIHIEVARAGSREVPLSRFILPSCEFTPNFNVTFGPTGKSVPASRLMTELLRQGNYWAPIVNLRGEWVLGAVETHMFDDPRTYYASALRRDLLQYLGFIGYDRFEHFGHIYQWGRYPDYGAGGWFNNPTNNAPIDMRMLQTNGLWVHSLVQYVLATRDMGFLQARRARWVATDGGQPQPICGAKAETADYVLISGDARLDGLAPKKHHSLGQSFTALAPFRSVRARLSNPAGALGVNDFQGGHIVIEEPNHGRLALYDRYGGVLLAETEFSIPPKQTEEIEVLSHTPLAAGSYYLELTDFDSGKRYFGPGITWQTELESDYKDGEAYNGPFHGDVADTLRLLFNYMRNYMGAAETNLTYYQNDPEYNVPDQKSGRNFVGQANSFWEGAGNAYDSYQSLWYPASCTAMAEMAALLGKEKEAAQYRQMRTLADEAYNKRFWHTVNENGREVSRYLHCEDWDGVKRDFGYTYNNLEAAARGIAGSERSRAILWWLDRGQYSPDGGKTWLDDIYSIWNLAAPYNTIENLTYLPACMTLPYRQVVSNGGSRPEVAARDLAVRTRYLSIDNMHERNIQVLERYANPDRMTGGRRNNGHWIGRWQFLGPSDAILDFEGFREIFPQSGSLTALEPAYYFDFNFSAQGLWMRPRVPSELESVRFNGFAYGGAVLDFMATAQRQEVAAGAVAQDEPLAITFKADGKFNKAGVRIRLASGSSSAGDAKASLALERKTSKGWEPVAQNWLSHLEDGGWAWVDAGQWMPGRGRYRIRLHDVRTASALSLAESAPGEPQLRLMTEYVELKIVERYNPNNISFALANSQGKTLSLVTPMSAIAEPGERILLRDKVKR